jgi:hypothetical protein
MNNPMEKLVIRFFGINEPAEPKIKIGIHAQYCPECGHVLSFSDDKPFCRGCQARIRGTYQSYRPYYERH